MANRVAGIFWGFDVGVGLADIRLMLGWVVAIFAKG
jgi:hypothetical protein